MRVDRLKLATALDRMADYVEGIESAKTAAVLAERTAAVDKLASAYATATGEELPDAIRHKLATSDKDIVSLIQSMSEKQASVVEELGGPSSKRDGSAEPRTVKEAADAADEAFLAWITK